jgi:hypothetical protein
MMKSVWSHLNSKFIYIILIQLANVDVWINWLFGLNDATWGTFNMDYGLYGIGFLRKNLLPKLWKLLETFGSINVAAKIKI